MSEVSGIFSVSFMFVPDHVRSIRLTWISNRHGGAQNMIKATEVPSWRRSRRCATGSCVEVARVGDCLLVRDSKDLGIAPLRFTEEQWKAFMAGVKAGTFGF
jgi:hypothetical protein